MIRKTKKLIEDRSKMSNFVNFSRIKFCFSPHCNFTTKAWFHKGILWVQICGNAGKEI